MPAPTTTISKFHQEVVSALRNSKDVKFTLKLSDQEGGMDKDIIITSIEISSNASYNNKIVDCWAIVEPNGVWHYPRNSRLELGKDLLKKRALMRMYEGRKR
jgi:hypothetical protein